ncbi:MAG: acetylglutamate kinase [Bacillota bacterium]|jgi:hypothetical protein
MYKKKDANSVFCYSPDQVNLMDTLRKLWEQHVMWTRSFIISTVANLGDLDLVTKRLLRNPTDMANQIKIFYGNQIANQFRKLFEEHLLIAAQLLNAAKAGNTRETDAARRKWYANADEIAAFLASINHYWSRREWQSMLYEHLAMTEDEAVKRLMGQYAQDIALFDEIEEQALRMADVMAAGIIKQFDV